MKNKCITLDGVKKNWYDKVWTIGSEGGGVYSPCRDMMRDCKRYDNETTFHYQAWHDREKCLIACSEFTKQYA